MYERVAVQGRQNVNLSLAKKIPVFSFVVMHILYNPVCFFGGLIEL